MFRFTIRELVLLTLVVAMGAGWWVDRSLALRGPEVRERRWRKQTIALAERLFAATRVNFRLKTPDGMVINFVDPNREIVDPLPDYTVSD